MKVLVVVLEPGCAMPPRALTFVPTLVAGLLPIPVAGLLPAPVASLLPTPVVALLPTPVVGLLPAPVASLLPTPVVALLPTPVVLLLTTPVLVLLSPGAGRLGTDLDAGAAFTCGAGLGGGALVFFWSPQASAEKISRTKSSVDFFRILLFGMFNLLTIFFSSESFLCDFTGQNVIVLETP